MKKVLLVIIFLIAGCSKVYEEMNSFTIYHDGSLREYFIYVPENLNEDIDLVIVFDVGDFLRIRTLVDVIKKYQIKTMNIDHHPHPEQNSFNYNISKI